MFALTAGENAPGQENCLGKLSGGICPWGKCPTIGTIPELLHISIETVACVVFTDTKTRLSNAV